MPQKTSIECPSCKKNITKSQFSVGCGICGTYFHTECVGVSDDALTSIRKNITKFVCMECKCSESNNCDNAILKRIDKIQQSIEAKIEVLSNDIECRMENGFQKLELKFNQLIKNFKTEINNEVTELKIDVANCVSIIQEEKKTNEAKYNKLLIAHNMLERRLNRSDILISGLNCSIDNVRENIIKIANLVGVDINGSDICHCCYLSRSKHFLVKFNSVQLRDTIMKNYFKAKPLLLKDIIGGIIESRIYLNDNLSPAAKKLQYLCRKLLSEKKIKKFYLRNMDTPKAKIIQLDGKSVFLDSIQCANLLVSSMEGVAVI